MTIHASQNIEDDHHDVTLTITGDTARQVMNQVQWTFGPHPSFTLTLTPEQAVALEDELEDAALEPARCDECRTNYVYPGDGGLCPRDAQDETARETYGMRAI